MKRPWMATALGASTMLLAACAEHLDDTRPVFGLGALTTRADVLRPMERGKAHFAAGQYGLALEAFKNALAEDPNSVRALNAIAATFDQVGRFDLSDRYYKRALRLAPDSADTLNNLGYSQLLRGNLPEAQELLARAMRINADDPVIQANLQRAQWQDLATEDPAAPVPPGVAGSPLEGDRPTPVPQPQQEQVRIVRLARGVQALTTLAPATSPQVEPVEDSGSADGPPVVAASRPIQTDGQADRPAPMPVAFRVSADPAERPWTIEVSNGTGRSRMATRMRGYLASKGLRVARLTNDASFSHAGSRITYRPDAQGVAAVLRAMLPFGVSFEPREDQRSDVRLLLGADLLAFDADLIQQLMASR